MKDTPGMNRLFAMNAYGVQSRLIKADASLRSILKSLNSMREICEKCAKTDVSLSLRASCQAELKVLKEDISRLSRAMTGSEFLALDIRGGTDDDLAAIDEAINKLSGFAEDPLENDCGEKLADWMNDLL
jgi:hypothetical protein